MVKQSEGEKENDLPSLRRNRNRQKWLIDQWHPKYKCKVCGRQFVENPKKGRISEETKELIDKLLLERLPIARVTGVSEQWLQSDVNKKYEEIPKEVEVSKKSKGRLTIECDEVWSYVGNKENKQWVWLAISCSAARVGKWPPRSKVRFRI